MQLPTYISDLLYRYDCVIVPEFGAFVTQRVSAEVNAETNTFLAPKKAILFNEQIKNNDGLLAQYIADVEKIPFEAAVSKIVAQVQRYKAQLIEGKTIHFTNIGDCTLNEVSKIEFSPVYNVNYLTSSFGLSGFTSNSISREVPIEAVDLAQPELKQNKTNYRSYLKYAAVGLVALTLGGFVVGKQYNEQIKSQNELTINAANAEVESKIQEATFVIPNPLPTVTFSLEKKAIGPYHIIAGAFRVEENANKKIEQLKALGFKAQKIGVNKYGLHQISYSSYSDKFEALKALRTIKTTENKNAWLLVKALD